MFHTTFSDKKFNASNRDGWTFGVAASLAGLHVFALLSLLAVLLMAVPARAEDLSCGAKDLMAGLETTNPAAYAQLTMQGEKIKNSGARFWKLEKPGQAPDWLLGTIHLTDPRVTNLPEQARAAYDGASTLVLESDEILDQKKASAALMAKPDLLMYSGAKTIKTYLNASDAKILEDGLKKRGIPLSAVVKMRPYIITSMVALSTCEMSRKASGAPFLDMKLAQDAKAAGKQVLGVETLSEQLAAMASLPNDFHIRSLISTVRYPDYTADLMETTINLYLKGEMGMVMPASVYFAPEKDPADARGMAEFEEKLITIRNHHMADRGASILARGNVFMAVGALHLIGDQGLVELFRKQGYTATPVM
jgi:uncharacterized protein YbaP (TraB family)